MKIAFIGQKGIPASYGGVERHVEELATRLYSMGHAVSVYCRPWYAGENKNRNQLPREYKGVRLVYLPSIKTKNLDAISHTFIATLHAIFQNYDVIHYQGIGPSILIVLAKLLRRKTKIVTTLHCPDYEHQKWGVMAKICLRLGEKIAVTFADHTVTVSTTYLNYLKRRYEKNPLFVPNGVNPPLVKKASRIKEKWGLVKNSYFLVVSRFIRHKGIHLVIEAYQKLPPTGKKLVIVGDSAFTDDYKQELLTLAGDNQDIIFTGYQTGKTLAELFSNAYLFLQASESEGLSITLLEALSYGLPVLSSDIPENLEVSGSFGFYFENKNVLDLTNKIQFLLSKPRLLSLKAQKAKEKVLHLYDWDKIAKQSELIYLEPLKSAKKQSNDGLFDYSLTNNL